MDRYYCIDETALACRQIPKYAMFKWCIGAYIGLKITIKWKEKKEKGPFPAHSHKHTYIYTPTAWIK